MAVKKIKPLELIRHYQETLRPYYKNFKKNPHFKSYIKSEVLKYGPNKTKPNEVAVIWMYTGFADMALLEPRDNKSVFRFILRNGEEVDMRIGKSVMRIVPKMDKFYIDHWGITNVNLYIPRNQKVDDNLKSMREMFGTHYSINKSTDFIIVSYKRIVIKDGGLILGILEIIKNKG